MNFKYISGLILATSTLAYGADRIESQEVKPREFRSQKSIEVRLDNDNPFLNLIPDLFYVDEDAGYTHGLGGKMEIIPAKGVFQNGERWNISAHSGLYTKNLTTSQDDYDAQFPHIPQEFNEVTRLEVTWDNVLAEQDSGKVYYLVGGGIGKINNSDDSGWGAAGQQRRWHDYKHNNLTPETTAMYDNQYGDENRAFGTVRAAMGKIVKFDDSMGDCQCEINRVKVEAGAEYISVRQGSNVYLLVGVDKTLFNLDNRFAVGVNFDNKATVYQNGSRDLKTFGGVYIKAGNWVIKTGATKRFGDGNTEFFQFENDDDTPIWMLSVEKKW